MTCSLIYCRLPTSLPPVPTFDAYPSSKKLNPKEFAMKMSMERRIAMGELDGANAASTGRKLIQMDKESEMFTTKPLYRKCNVVEKFLHDRPPALSSVSLITCTILVESCFQELHQQFYFFIIVLPLILLKHILFRRFLLLLRRAVFPVYWPTAPVCICTNAAFPTTAH